MSIKVDSHKKEKIKEELESVDKTGLKKHNSETTLKLKVDFTKFGTDVFNQSNYIKEVQNRKTKEMEYLCTKCPYKSDDLTLDNHGNYSMDTSYTLAYVYKCDPGHSVWQLTCMDTLYINTPFPSFFYSELL
jgi:hypothetical protein